MKILETGNNMYNTFLSLLNNINRDNLSSKIIELKLYIDKVNINYNKGVIFELILLYSNDIVISNALFDLFKDKFDTLIINDTNISLIHHLLVRQYYNRSLERIFTIINNRFNKYHILNLIYNFETYYFDDVVTDVYNENVIKYIKTLEEKLNYGE